MDTERSGRVEERRREGLLGESASMGWVVGQCHFRMADGKNAERLRDVMGSTGSKPLNNVRVPILSP